MRTLTGHHAAHRAAANAQSYAAGKQFSPYCVNLIKMNKRNLYPLARGKMDIPFAVSLGHLQNSFNLLQRKIPAGHPQAHGKIVFLQLFQETTLLQFGNIHSILFLPHN